MKLIFYLVFGNLLTEITVFNGITEYPTKERRLPLIEEAHSLAAGGHKGVTET